MTNAEKIVAVLSKQAPGAGICDDCLESLADVHPRQQVNQICHKLQAKGIVARSSGDCAVCHHAPGKELNYLTPMAPSRTERIRETSLVSATPSLGAQTDELSQWLFDAQTFLDGIERVSDSREPFAARVARLKRDGAISPSLSSVMLLLNT